MATTREGSTRSPKAFTCPIHVSTSSRNLVVCIDGTSNQFGIQNTNIVELYSHITKSDTQLTYYSSGLGAIAKIAGRPLGHEISNSLDMAVGRNLHKVILASYRWLSDNYQDGDSIFLFGFSRGAYQVRALAGMIARVGLLLPGNNEQIPFAFELYSRTEDGDWVFSPTGSIISSGTATKESKKRTESTELAKTFQKTFCRSNVHIHFVGVWDTVSSVGFFSRKMLPCTTTPCENICYFRHALALDERRVKFLPEYVYGGRACHNNDERIKEVWFPGCHADVGGGNRRNERLQSGDIPLLWMRSQAISAGLEMTPAAVMWKIDDLNKPITRSLRHVWWLSELLPLTRLLYYNSDSLTFRPHLGGPRRILPGQKVHVSALFKNNYKPYAHFHNNPGGWPEPMFWNDASSHQRLRNLSDLWEKDIFDESSVGTLLDNLKRGQPNLDALDRLAFMASFDDCKVLISKCEDARQILSTFLWSKNELARLSTAATYCELGWDWPLDAAHSELGQQIIEDVSKLLQSHTDSRRACIYMPSLCKRAELKEGLLKKESLQRLVRLCNSAPVIKYVEGTSTVAFHSAHALSMLLKLDADFARKLIEIGAVTDVIEGLHSNCNPVLVSLLSVVDGMATHKSGREVMKAGPTIPSLLKLIKKFDDFVTPAAVRVLCSLLQDSEMRNRMLQFGVLARFLEVLCRRSDEAKRVTCDALTKFAQHREVQDALSRDGYLRKLAKRARSDAPRKRDGAIQVLVELGKNQALRKAVTEAIKAAQTIDVLAGRLGWKSSALSAASALARLAKMDDVATMVSENETGPRVGIVGMLRRRLFDGAHEEDGLKVLSELLERERLRTAVVQAGAIDVLRKMIDSKRLEDTHAGLRYLGAFACHVHALSGHQVSSLVPRVVKALRSPHRRVQRTATDVLRVLSAQEDLRAPIVQGLLDLLKDPRADVVLAASALLGSLAAHESVRETVLMRDSFLNPSHAYHDGLDLARDDKAGSQGAGDAYESVGRMIKSMQVDQSEETRASGTEDYGEKERE